MNVILDTHIILWAVTEDRRLPDKAREIISAKENEIFYSVASIWEVTIKHMAHPEHMPVSGKQLAAYCERAGYNKLCIREDHIFELETLKPDEKVADHKDPFDRIMLAQAKAENMYFMTHDSLIPFYNEPCVIAI